MTENEGNGIDYTGVPTTPTGDGGNNYSKNLTIYFYNKQNEIDKDDDFTVEDISTYGLDVTNNKINISTTAKFINYIKSFVRVCTKDIPNKLDKSEYNAKMQQIDSILANLTDNVESLNSGFINTVYPVGSVYMSFSSTDPSVLFEGTNWLKLENRFLLGSGSKTVESVGGEENHILNIDEMPIHNHTQNAHNHTLGDNLYFLGTKQSDGTSANFGTTNTFYRFNKLDTDNGYASIMYTEDAALVGEPKNTTNSTPTINNRGGNKGHNNMPPYMVVHMWRRVS